MTVEKPKKRLELIFSVTFPIIIMFNIVLLSNQFTLLLQSTSIFLINLSYILFTYSSFADRINGLIRVLCSLLIVCMFGWGLVFSEIPIEFNFFSSLKIGWIVGLLVVTYLNFQFLRYNYKELKSWHFVDNKNSTQSSKTVIIYWCLGMFTFSLLFIVIGHLYVSSIGIMLFIITLISFGGSTLILARQHIGIISTNSIFTDAKAGIFWFGILICTLSISLFWFPSVNFIALLSLVIGLTIVEYVITAREGFNKYFKSTTIPSIAIILLLQFLILKIIT